MDWLNIIQMVLRYGPVVKSILDEANSNDDVVTKVKTSLPSLVPVLEDIGAKFFPKAAPAIHIVGAAVAAFDPDVTKWLQGALNTLVSPSPNLVVDGLYGPKTRAAIEAFQAANGLTVDGLAGSITQALIGSLLVKRPSL